MASSIRICDNGSYGRFATSINGADNPLVASTDTGGRFGKITFELSVSNAADINVKAVDVITNQDATASLRGDA